MGKYLGGLTQTTVSCLQHLYKTPDDVKPPHPNNYFGIFEPSWFSLRPEDLDQFFEEVQRNLVGRRPEVEGINGGYLYRSQTGQSWYLESDLDFQYGMALTSPQKITKIQVGSYEQLGNLQDMLAALKRYFCYRIDSEDRKYPGVYPPRCNVTGCDCCSLSPTKVLSISWGWAEAEFTAKHLQRQCLEFLKLGLMGTTVIVSTSDHGKTAATSINNSCIDDNTGNSSGGGLSLSHPASCP